MGSPVGNLGRIFIENGGVVFGRFLWDVFCWLICFGWIGYNFDGKGLALGDSLCLAYRKNSNNWTL